MSDFIKKVPWGMVTFLLQIGLMVILWLHNLSVNAAVNERLKSYVTEGEMTMREESHKTWSNEAIKRIDGKMDDILDRVKRIENKL